MNTVKREAFARMGWTKTDGWCSAGEWAAAGVNEHRHIYIVYAPYSVCENYILYTIIILNAL